MRRVVAIFLLSGAFSNAGCTLGGGTVQVAAPLAPVAALPPGLDPLASEPTPGLTRLVLDGNGKPLTVTEVLESNDSNAIGIGTPVYVFGHSERTRPICITPCEFDFERGLHVLRFSDGEGDADRVQVQVGSKRKLVRVALGHSELSTQTGMTGLALQIVGATAAIMGAAVLAVSASSQQARSYQSTGIALTLGGGAAFLVGIPLSYEEPSRRQPSSITQADLPLENAR